MISPNRFLLIRFAAALKWLQNKHRLAHEQRQKSKLAFYVQATQAKMEILNRISFYSKRNWVLHSVLSFSFRSNFPRQSSQRCSKFLDVFTSYKSRNSSSSIKALVQSNIFRVSLNKVTKILSMTVVNVLLCRGTNLNTNFSASRTAFYSQSFLGHGVPLPAAWGILKSLFLG